MHLAPPAQESSWTSLGTPRDELQLRFTLPTGQSFRWRQTGHDEYTGVVGSRVVQMRQLDNDVIWRVIARGEDALAADDAVVLADYFNLGTSLSSLCHEWAARDKRYMDIHPFFKGARMLRQDPVECLFQFICSSNNHISRIHGMVERMCSTYGTRLHASQSPAVAADGGTCAAVGEADQGSAAAAGTLSFYAFPTIEQLSAATEAELRADGFGYRAKFITGTVKQLLEKPGGGAAWLHGLRAVPYTEAAEALCELPGIGPKVAACICLFSLDKHAAIPVDTHVWQIAVRYYLPKLAGKTLTKKLHEDVAGAFVSRFGLYAGWAHNTLFISELASHQEHLPPQLRSSHKSGSRATPAKAKGSAPAADVSTPTMASDVSTTTAAVVEIDTIAGGVKVAGTAGSVSGSSVARIEIRAFDLDLADATPISSSVVNDTPKTGGRRRKSAQPSPATGPPLGSKSELDSQLGEGQPQGRRRTNKRQKS